MLEDLLLKFDKISPI